MLRILRMLTLVTVMAVLGAAATGCSTQQVPTYVQYCVQYNLDCDALMDRLQEGSPGWLPERPRLPSPETDLPVQTLGTADVPADLRAWAEAQQNRETPAYTVLETADGTLIGVSGGLQPTGGYRVVVDGVHRRGDGWFVRARVVPPPPGAPVTMALTTPVGFYRLPGVHGPVRVLVEDNGPAIEPETADPFTVRPTWHRDGVLRVTGKAQVPDLHLELVSGRDVLARADTQVKDGVYVADILVPPDAQHLTLVVTTVEPGGGRTLAQVPVQPNIPADEVWSDNFHVKHPRQVDREHVLIEGRARVFEATFMVEVWDGDRPVASEVVMADDGAPAFGHFRVRLRLPAGVPAGARVLFVTHSARDGSRQVELDLPVQPGG